MRKIWYKNAITEAMREEMQRDDRVFIIGKMSILPAGFLKSQKAFLRSLTKRLKGTPISEAAFIGPQQERQ